MKSIIETQQLCKKFLGNHAVSDLNLHVPAGSTFAFLGANGSGKTTTIKVLMNLLRPSSGESFVLGRNSRDLNPRDFMQIGYVSENQQQPLWMTVRELLDFCAPLYPSWDRNFEKRLLKEFDLPEKRKLKDLSRGMLMKAVLISSLAYRPKLLVLDEPFTGLDPLVRDEFISGMLESSEREGWTVFISSHDIDEVERLATDIGILDKGKLRLSEPVDSLQSRFRKVEMIHDGKITHTPDNWKQLEQSGNLTTFTDNAFINEHATAAFIKSQCPQAKDITFTPMSLKEIYLTIARDFRKENRTT